MANRSFTLWFTGLSGAGKSTLAEVIEQRFKAGGRKVEVLDGDVVRTNLSKGLGFSREDRDTNIKRIAFVCKLLTRNGVISISAAISPYREARAWARKEIGDFVEVYLECPVDICRQRDVKGLYQQADTGIITNFTGVSDPYEEPERPELVLETDKETVEECVARIFAKLTELGYLEPEAACEAGVEDQAAESINERQSLSYFRVDQKHLRASTRGLIAPHGGELVVNMVGETERLDLQERARSLPRVVISPRQLADLEMLAVGAYSPLRGFMNRADYLSVVNEMHLSNGLPWSIPITLSISAEQAGILKEGSQIALVDPRGGLCAVMTLEEQYGYDMRLEARKVYRTTEEAHPGVRALSQQDEVLLGGPVRVISLQQRAFARYRYTPAQARQLFAERGWQRIVGFQTRNPVHRAHEYIQKCALEMVDGLFLHPLVGETKDDDIPAEVRMRCYEVLLEHYYPPDRVVLGVLPAAMRYAGPREAIFHALIRKNYGCTHFIVGRDHAGAGNYYGTYDAQTIFSEFDPVKLGIRPIFFENAYYCRMCDAMVSSKTCPHDSEQHVTLSGTKVRKMLQLGELPPREFSRPEVVQILMEAMLQGVKK